MGKIKRLRRGRRATDWIGFAVGFFAGGVLAYWFDSLLNQRRAQLGLGQPHVKPPFPTASFAKDQDLKPGYD